MNLKLSVICNDRFPSKIAHGVYLARLCDSLAGEGVDVELVVPRRLRKLKVDPFEFYAIKNKFKIVRLWTIDFNIFGFILKNVAYWLQYVTFQKAVFFYFLFRSRDRIIYTLDDLGCALHFLGYKTIFEIHQTIGSRQKFLLPLIRRADFISVTNSIIKQDFITHRFSENKIGVFPNGVNLEDFEITESKLELRKKFGIPESAKIISYIGKYKTLGSEKGVSELVEVFAYITKEVSDAFLLIVGVNDGENKELEKMLFDMGVQRRAFKIVTHVPQKEIFKYMKVSDIFVMNYPDTFHYRYNMSPMKMFEYMASGVPIVATDLPTIRDVLSNDTAVLIKSDDKESLKNGIEKLIEDKKLGSMLALKAYEEAKKYTWKSRAQKIIEKLKFI